MVCSFGFQTCMGFNFQFGPPVVCELSPMPWDAPTASLVNDANWDHYSIIPWNCKIFHTRRPLGVLLRVTILSSLASTEVILITTIGAYCDRKVDIMMTWSPMKECPIKDKQHFFNLIFSDISRFIDIFTHIRHGGYNVIALSYDNPSNDERCGLNRQFSNHYHSKISNNKAWTAYITLSRSYDINTEPSVSLNTLHLWIKVGEIN